MKITRENFKNIVREVMIDESEYQEFFKKALEKAGKSIPSMSDEEKKKFFNNIEKTWKGKGTKNERFGRGEDGIDRQGPTFGSADESIEELTKAQEKLPPALQKAIEKKDKKKEEVKESVNEDSMDWEKNFKGYNEKELKVISKFIIMHPQSIDGVIKMSKHKPSHFKRTIQKMAKKGLGESLNKEEVKESIIKEGFATWEMSFADMNLNGVKLSKKNKYKVKARNTVEAIKKAAKMAGLKGNDWIATQTNYLKKIG